jgi:hypothetical protein
MHKAQQPKPPAKIYALTLNFSDCRSGGLLLRKQFTFSETPLCGNPTYNCKLILEAEYICDIIYLREEWGLY